MPGTYTVHHVGGEGLFFLAVPAPSLLRAIPWQLGFLRSFPKRFLAGNSAGYSCCLHCRYSSTDVTGFTAGILIVSSTRSRVQIDLIFFFLMCTKKKNTKLQRYLALLIPGGSRHRRRKINRPYMQIMTFCAAP